MSSPLKQQIIEQTKATMRARDRVPLGVLRLIQSELKRVEVDERIELDDARILSILDKMVKQRNESIKQFHKGQRLDLVEKEQAEIDLIQQFLPSPLTELELSSLIDEAIAATQAQSMRDMGKVMGQIRPKIQGRADAASVSRMVKSRLSQP